MVLMIFIKTFSLYAFISLFPLQCFILHAFPTESNNTKSSPLEFFNQFQGLQKGDKAKGIHELKKYLQSLGYLDQSSQYVQEHDDNFDDNLHSAIKTYQINYNLQPKGILDRETISKMAMPRCGAPDIINGTTRMKAGASNFHLDYAFYDQNTVWPSNKMTLNYAIKPWTPVFAIGPIIQALQKWDSLTPFTFKRIKDFDRADIKISFERGEHGDGHPFDGPYRSPGNVLAHGWPPPDGSLHFDASEYWVNGAVTDAFDIKTVALHELGHVMGLAHSSDPGAIMYPYLPMGSTKGLNDDDDIRGIKALYGG